MSTIQELENKLKTNFEQVIVEYQEKFQESKQKFHTEFGTSFKDRTDKNNLQKEILLNLTDIIKLLSQLIDKFNQRNPDKILGISIESEFYHSIKISPILSILTDIIIWTSDKYIEVINRFDREINEMQKHLSERLDTDAIDIIGPAIFETIKVEKKQMVQQFESYNEETLIIQRHWLRASDKIPKHIFQIFESSIFFEDSYVQKFIIDNCASLPTEYRVKWLFTDFKYINYIVSKKINMNFLTEDIDFLFATYLKNPENIHSIIIICCILSKVKLTVSNNKLIRIVSILLTIISKLNSEKKNIEKDKFENTLSLLIDTINNILELSINIDTNLKLSYPIINSYLVYLIPSILNGIYGQYDKIDESINNVIAKVSTEHIMIIYMASTSDTSSDIKFKNINRTELEKWIQIYKHIGAEEEYYEIEDGLLCSCVVKPAFLPNTELVFDRYVIESSLWETCINSYTREPLTMEEFNEYNEQSHVQEEIKKKNEIIKRLIKKYK